jgi:hypothetical protein
MYITHYLNFRFGTCTFPPLVLSTLVRTGRNQPVRHELTIIKHPFAFLITSPTVITRVKLYLKASQIHMLEVLSRFLRAFGKMLL